MLIVRTGLLSEGFMDRFGVEVSFITCVFDVFGVDQCFIIGVLEDFGVDGYYIFQYMCFRGFLVLTGSSHMFFNDFGVYWSVIT